MQHPLDRQRLQAELLIPWLMVAAAVLELVALVLVCLIQGESLQRPLPEDTREWLRTGLYAVAIVTFPFTNLLRHVQMRLNQTMPLEHRPFAKVAKKRYLRAVIVSIALIQSPGLYGFIMYVLGDSSNTLTIFTIMSALGLYLYRPKLGEYESLMAALADPDHE